MKKPFEIFLVWSEKILRVPADKTALDVLQEAGVPVDKGCENGECGTCSTEYVEGDVIHRDTCLTAATREYEFCPCVSRAKGRLVLPL